MFCHAVRFVIKDLKALENVTTRVAIDIKVLKDLRWHLDAVQRGGLSPALRAHRDQESLLRGRNRDQEVSPTEHIEI